MLNAARTTLVLAVLVLPGSRRMEFAPEPDTSLTKTFHLVAELALEDLVLDVGGQEIDPSALGSPSVEFFVEYTVVVTDSYGESVDGHPTIERTFEEITAESRLEGSVVEDGSDPSDGSSPLEGETVVFTWDPESEAYEATSETVDEELLEELRPDMDLRFLLPDGGADLEQRWEVTDFGLDLLQPGGDLALEFEGAEETDGLDEESAEAFEDAAADLMETPIEAEFREVSDADGEERGTVDLAMEIDSTIDLTPWLDQLIDQGDIDVGESGAEVVLAEVYLEASPRGTLVWDLESGVFHEFELQTLCIATFEAEASIESMELDISFSAEFSGDLSITAEAGS